jgi:hypothetical protein
MYKEGRQKTEKLDLFIYSTEIGERKWEKNKKEKIKNKKKYGDD